MTVLQSFGIHKRRTSMAELFISSVCGKNTYPSDTLSARRVMVHYAGQRLAGEA